nr:MAG TPA: hypothetical protein [Bacteriophage sp.]
MEQHRKQLLYLFLSRNAPDLERPPRYGLRYSWEIITGKIEI